MYSFESGEQIKKPAASKTENPAVKPAPKGENEGYTFTHHVDTFGDSLRAEDENPEADQSHH